MPLSREWLEKEGLFSVIVQSQRTPCAAETADVSNLETVNQIWSTSIPDEDKSFWRRREAYMLDLRLLEWRLSGLLPRSIAFFTTQAVGSTNKHDLQTITGMNFHITEESDDEQSEPEISKKTGNKVKKKMTSNGKGDVGFSEAYTRTYALTNAQTHPKPHTTKQQNGKTTHHKTTQQHSKSKTQRT